MKKILILFVFVLLLLFSSCSNTGSDKLIKAVEKGDYIEAKEIYYNKILGNYEKELSIKNSLIELMFSKIDDYNNGKCTYDHVYSIIMTVEELDVLDNLDIEGAYYGLEYLNQSKDSFIDAENFFYSGLYLDAIKCYYNVVYDDINYISALDKIEISKEKLIIDLEEKVLEYSKEKQYKKAMVLIEDILTEVENIPKIYDIYDDIASECIENAISEAKAVFENNKDYEGAIRVITEAINIVGDNEILSAELENYQSYIPIAITDLEYYEKGTYVSIGHAFDKIAKDVSGNQYSKNNIIYPHAGTSITSIPKSEDDSALEYYINGEYSLIEGILYLPYISRGADSPEMASAFKIYGDGILLYEAPQFIKGVTKPVKFSVDISNVMSLKIVIMGLWRESGGWPGVYSRNPMICAAEIMLSK